LSCALAALGHFDGQQLTKGETTTVAKPNYQFEKRKREMDKKAKKAEKKKRRDENQASGGGTETSEETPAPAAETP
jgi:hypothetical protein